MDVSGTTVTISAERLKALEELEKKASTIDKYTEKTRTCALKYYHNKKDEINKRRRELYKEKKAAASAPTNPPASA